MASIEKRRYFYRTVFRFEGRKFSRSLNTKSEKAALGTLNRLEDNLPRAELGTLAIPEGADVATFLLSDVRRTAKRDNSKIKTLGELFDGFFAALPSDSIPDVCFRSLHRSTQKRNHAIQNRGPWSRRINHHHPREKACEGP